MSERNIESFKSLQEGSKWLAAVYTTACVGLWSRLSASDEVKAWLLAAWFMFGMALLCAAAMMVCTPARLARLHTRDGQKWVERLAAWQFRCFVVGVMLAATHLAIENVVRTEEPLVTAARVTDAKGPLKHEERLILTMLMHKAAATASGATAEELAGVFAELSASSKGPLLQSVRRFEAASTTSISLLGLLSRQYVVSRPAAGGQGLVYQITGTGVEEVKAGPGGK